MQKYIIHTSEKIAVIQWTVAIELSDVNDALEELAQTVKNPVPLLLITHSDEFEASWHGLNEMVNLFGKYRKHLTDKVAYVVPRNVHPGLRHIAHILFSGIGVDFVPFRDVKEAREWLGEIPR